MESRRRVGHFKDRKVADFRRVLKRVEDPHIRAAIEKDAHLTEAALLLNIAVISLDNKQRVYLCALAERYKKLGGLQWINPTEVGEDCLVWLSGCCSDQGFERLTQ
ncbi:hypothetical protein [Actinokineospora globicatena]|uniref:hypothetical protein n=1 Tax=Actinokineospora globicatena TaxID=103729 RepID=UPI0020A31313|nr:hypothetical protein [Actinokineospora globicatena]